MWACKTVEESGESVQGIYSLILNGWYLFGSCKHGQLAGARIFHVWRCLHSVFGFAHGQSFLVSSWAALAVAAAPSFQACFACVHMYILYACVYKCVCVYVCRHDICIYMHVCMYLYIYTFIHMCMCMCMHICA